MNHPSHPFILKRAGAVLICIGVIDIAVMIYCFFNRISYSSSFNILAVAAGAFLVGGNLRAASIVRWLAVFLFTVTLGFVVVLVFMRPMSLVVTHLRLYPISFIASLAREIVALVLLLWLYRELGRAPVLEARAGAGRKPRDMRIPAAVGLVSTVAAVAFVKILLDGEAAEKAKAAVRERLGPAYSYHVSSLKMNSNAEGKRIAAVVTAWNDTEIQNVSLTWSEK